MCSENYSNKFFENGNSKIFSDELEIIKKRREAKREMCKDNEKTEKKSQTEQNNQKIQSEQGNQKTGTPSISNNLLGLALSGGGIRSATFNLGFIQGLFREKIFDKIDYLSTVSGGGYIGSCLSSLFNSDWKDKKENLLDAENFPFHKIENTSAKNEQNKTKSVIEGQDKEPVRRLRYFSNYLTAEGGLIRKYFSPLYTILRGLLLNFILLLPYILALALILSVIWKGSIKNEISLGFYPLIKVLNVKDFREDVTKRDSIRQELSDVQMKVDFIKKEYGGMYGVPSSIRADSAYLSKQINSLQKSDTIFSAKVSEHWKSIWVIPLNIFLFLTLIVHPIVRKIFAKKFTLDKIFPVIFGISIGLLFVNMLGVFVAYYWKIIELYYREISLISFLGFWLPQLLKKNGSKGAEEGKSLVDKLIPILIAIIPVLLILLFTIEISNLFIFGRSELFSFNFLRGINLFSPVGIAASLGIIVFIFLLTRILININDISLHSFYRNRLSRAYMIQSDPKAKYPFSKLIHQDEIKIHKLENEYSPFHIINTNLNLCKKMPKDNDTSKKGIFRSGENFVFTPIWSGSEKTGYLKTEFYEKLDTHLNLGTAMAISGAAANIGMGLKHLAVFRIIMGLLNIRLGYWAINPKKYMTEDNESIPGNLKRKLLNVSEKYFPSTYYGILKEWFGSYSLNDNFINLSDGGHFDNLGVYELIRRRCKFIIASDAEADPKMKFGGLSELIRLARIDFGVEIDINLSDIIPLEGYSKSYCAVGEIKYPNIGDGEEFGYLLYCKSSLTGNEPPHLREYKISHPSFPHESTADQWFDESQFEVYRELGYQIAKAAFRPASERHNKEEKCKSLEEKFIKLKQQWHPHSEDIEKKFTMHSNKLSGIISSVMHDTDLEFMDVQMYPEWLNLINNVNDKPKFEFWLPVKYESVRKGFYLCNQMLQLMEDVYMDLNLESQYYYPDNRGWMNLFMHWSWTGMFRVTWAISACTFGLRFQQFCEKRLNLSRGKIKIHTVKDHISLGSKLNKYEIKLIKEIEKKCTDESIKFSYDQLHCFNLIIQNPLNTDEEKIFTYGFALTNKEKVDNSEKSELVLFRIQNHLRGMGLGRETLRELIKEIPGLVRGDMGKCVSEILVGIDPMESPAAFDRLYKSVKSEREEFSAYKSSV